jgi:hypothetical protein
MEHEFDFDPPSTDLPRLPAPDVIGPVVGFRDWRLGEAGLESPRTGTVWSGRVLRAECLPRTAEDFVRRAHRAPGHDCSCGVHVNYRPNADVSKVDYRGVSGIVTVWGHVEAHGTGMRAEYARVEALAIYKHWTRRMRSAVADVAAQVGADIVDLDDLADAAHRYAAPLPSVLVDLAGPSSTSRAGAPRRRVIVSEGLGAGPMSDVG